LFYILGFIRDAANFAFKQFCILNKNLTLGEDSIQNMVSIITRPNAVAAQDMLDLNQDGDGDEEEEEGSSGDDEGIDSDE
jgi:hypothetical protein